MYELFCDSLIRSMLMSPPWSACTRLRMSHLPPFRMRQLLIAADIKIAGTWG